MPYLECPHCHRTAFTRARAAAEIACHHCGTTLAPLAVDPAALLAGAVRTRFARDAATDATRTRFVREPQRLTD